MHGHPQRREQMVFIMSISVFATSSMMDELIVNVMLLYFFFFSVVFWMRTICSVWDHKVFISLVDDQLLVLHPEQLLAGPDYFVIG